MRSEVVEHTLLSPEPLISSDINDSIPLSSMTNTTVSVAFFANSWIFYRLKPTCEKLHSYTGKSTSAEIRQLTLKFV